MKLVDPLLECSMVSDRDIRNSIVNELDSIKDRIQRHDATRVDVINIVNRCSDFGDGIENLINAVRLYEGNSEPMKKVFGVIAHILDDKNIIGYENLSELLPILLESGISPDDLKKYYPASLPEKFKSDLKAVTLFSVIKKLCDLLPDKKTHPLLTFVQKIADKINNERLNEWINTVVSEYENKHDVKIRRNPDEPAQSLPIHLIVRLTPDFSNRNRKKNKLYTVRIYLWKSQDDILLIYPEAVSSDGEVPDETLPLSDIREKLDECIYSKFRGYKKKFVEFILPCELIALDIDQWEMKQGVPFAAIKLGEEYPVYIRLDRQASRQSFCDEWEKRWGYFENHAQSHDSSVSWFCNHQTYKHKNLCKGFSCSESKSCLMITFMPEPNDDGKGLGHVILQAGIPVALCYRKNVSKIENPDKVENDMRAIIKDVCLSELRELIRDKRREVPDGDKQHIGNHLTLIWDDPDRVLLKQPNDPDPLGYSEKG